MYRLGVGAPMDTARVMFLSMVECVEATQTGAIPFPGILTDLIIDSGVNVSRMAWSPPIFKTMIDAATINKALAKRHATQAEPEVEPEVEAAAEPVQVQDTEDEAEDELQNVWSSIERLSRDVSGVQVDIERIRSRQDQMYDISLRQLRLAEADHRARRMQFPDGYQDMPPYEPYQTQEPGAGGSMD